MTDPGLKESELLSAAFFFAHDLLRLPSPEQWAHLNSTRTEQIWTALAGATGIPPAMGLPEEDAIYKAEYLAVFGDGKLSGPVSLAESYYLHHEPRESLRRENLAFYNAFELQPREKGEEAADHLLRQLEFVGYLYRLESAVLSLPDESRPPDAADKLRRLRQARIEYVSRHVSSWLPRATQAAAAVQVVWARNFLTLAEELAAAAGR